MVTEQQLTSTLDDFLAGGSLPQAYLFISPNNSAIDLAKSFATKLTGKDFPNIDTLSFDASEDNSIQAIREVLNIAALMPVVASHKVVIMTGMENASAQMMNALLKTLEEPPSHAIFILLSTQPLLSTVMSRCQVFKLNQQGESEELSEELNEAIALIVSVRSSGLAERMALVPTLAELDDELLSQAIEHWLSTQVSDLKQEPKNFAAVRNTMETLQSLRGNFNKKMVLSNFVTNSLG